MQYEVDPKDMRKNLLKDALKPANITRTRRSRVRRHGGPVTRVLFSINPEQLRTVDNYAHENFMSRSELIRQAVYEYTRPPIDVPVDEDELLAALKQRALSRNLRKHMKETTLESWH